jgi:glycosyltransferase involved in cell wall biosynthesis
MAGQINRGSEYKVTIITSVYRASSFMVGLLENVVSQTAFAQCEWIIVDVNRPSTAHCIASESIVRYMKDYPNICYERLSPDPGVYGVWNEAIRCADSDYITNWNCDDRRYPDSLQKQIEFFDQNPDIDLLYNDQYWHTTPNWLPWDRRYAKMNPYPIHHTLNGDKLLHKTKPKYSLAAMEFNLPHNDPIWRRDLHEKFGFFREDTITVADHDFWLRCAVRGSKFAKMDDIMGIYYCNPEGISTNINSQKDIRIEENNIILPIVNNIRGGAYK